jgi:hypothetical protein
MNGATPPGTIPPSAPNQPNRNKPASVIVAIVALLVLLGVNSLGGLSQGIANRATLIQLGVTVVMGGLILWGLIVGHRLAWQWGRLIGILASLFYLISLVIVFAATSHVENAALVRLIAIGILGVQIACMLTIFFSLGQPSAKQYFNLRCPQCGRFTKQAADFLFNKAKCGQCRTAW